jgi:hypothetical protein
MLVVLVTISCSGCPESAIDWQEEQIQIQEAVLLDVAKQDAIPLPPEGSHLLLCVGIGPGPGHAPEDPSPELLQMLRRRNPETYPASECDISVNGVQHKPTGSGGILVGVGAATRTADRVATVLGWYFAAGYNARSWTYTMNRHEGSWKVATVKLKAVAAARRWLDAVA